MNATVSMIQCEPTSWTDRLRQVDVLRKTIWAARRFRTAAIERYLNISTPYPNTQRFDLATHFNDAVPNEPVDYLLLRRFIEPVRLQPDDVVFDIGCGMGRAVCMLARRRIRKCIGIEFDASLAFIARKNARQLRGRKAEIEIRQGDAIEAEYSGGTVYWLFNPFGSETLRVVLERIEASLCRSPRVIRIAYINPIHEREFERCAWLHLHGRRNSKYFSYGASYWSNAPGNAPNSSANLHRTPESRKLLDRFGWDRRTRCSCRVVEAAS